MVIATSSREPYASSSTSTVRNWAIDNNAHCGGSLYRRLSHFKTVTTGFGWIGALNKLDLANATINIRSLSRPSSGEAGRPPTPLEPKGFTGAGVIVVISFSASDSEWGRKFEAPDRLEPSQVQRRQDEETKATTSLSFISTIREHSRRVPERISGAASETGARISAANEQRISAWPGCRRRHRTRPSHTDADTAHYNGLLESP